MIVDGYPASIMGTNEKSLCLCFSSINIYVGQFLVLKKKNWAWSKFFGKMENSLVLNLRINFKT
jgi:hypothetical protein